MGTNSSSNIPNSMAEQLGKIHEKLNAIGVENGQLRKEIDAVKAQNKSSLRKKTTSTRDSFIDLFLCTFFVVLLVVFVTVIAFGLYEKHHKLKMADGQQQAKLVNELVAEAIELKMTELMKLMADKLAEKAEEKVKHHQQDLPGMITAQLEQLLAGKMAEIDSKLQKQLHDWIEKNQPKSSSDQQQDDDYKMAIADQLKMAAEHFEREIAELRANFTASVESQAAERQNKQAADEARSDSLNSNLTFIFYSILLLLCFFFFVFTATCYWKIAELPLVTRCIFYTLALVFAGIFHSLFNSIAKFLFCIARGSIQQALWG